MNAKNLATVGVVAVLFIVFYVLLKLFFSILVWIGPAAFIIFGLGFWVGMRFAKRKRTT